MKTLDQINDDIKREVELRMEKCKPVFDAAQSVEFSTVMQGAFRDVEVNTKFLVLFDIVEKLDKYLEFPSLDGSMDRQPLRKELQELINKL